MYLQRLTLTVILSLTACAGQADTFELSDPASEILREQNNAEENTQPSGPASEADSNWTSRGVGSTVCSQHLLSKQESLPQYDSDLYWLQGFIEGVGYQRHVTLGDNRLSPDTTLESTTLWVENYCIENPFDNLDGAARAYLRKLSQ